MRPPRPCRQRQVQVVHEAASLHEGAIHLACPKRQTVLLELRRDRGSIDSEYLRAARREVVSPVRQEPHLEMAALASVAPYSVWQGGYTAQRFEHRLLYVGTTRLTSSPPAVILGPAKRQREPPSDASIHRETPPRGGVLPRSTPPLRPGGVFDRSLGRSGMDQAT